MRVVALDIATRTGIAVGDVGADPSAWSVDLGAGKSEDARFAKLLATVDKLIRAEAPDLVAIEAPIGGPHASALLIGFVAIARGVCAARGVPVKAITSASVRKHFLGHVPTVRGQSAKNKAAAKKAIKEQVMARCKLLGWDMPDHDAADAAACWDYACALESPAAALRSAPLLGRVHGAGQ